MYDNICYKNPFLRDVIFRIDFASPIDNFSKGVPSDFSKLILKLFPILERQTQHTQEVEFRGRNLQTKSTESAQWVFWGKFKEKSITISDNLLLYKNKSYSSFEDMKHELFSIIEYIHNHYSNITTSRIGLRFVNIISLDEDNPLDWNEYVNEIFLGIINVTENKDKISRAFHILSYNFDGLIVKYQFGIANPDYPAIVRKKEFVLDLDAFIHGSLEFLELNEFLNSAHSKIQELFENSITDITRNKMGVVNE